MIRGDDFKNLQERNRAWFALLFAAAIIAMLLSAVQGISIYSIKGFPVELFLSGFLIFLLPILLSLGAVLLLNRFVLPGDGRGPARRLVWIGFLLRLAFLLIIPLALPLWGYETDQQQAGFLSTDAYNASATAWEATQTDQPVYETWRFDKGDNTGGLTVIGVTAYRLFNPRLERPLLLALAAAVFSTMAVAAVFRFGELQFSRRVTLLATFIVAVYPEAIMIGSAHQQQGYLAMIFGWLLFFSVAYFLRKTPSGESLSLPHPWGCLLGVGVCLFGFRFISAQFFLIAVTITAICFMWFSNPRTTIGRWIWIAGGLAAALLIGLKILSDLNLISSSWDILAKQTKFLFGQAWLEFDKMILREGGEDMFQGTVTSMPRSTAFVIAGFYGVLQPVLPAAIGYRNLEAIGGGIWQVLGIWRATAWYLVLPLVFYGGLSAIRGIKPRYPETLMSLFFWVLAYASSYRSLGDQWDNPRYRLFVLIPMALLAAWAWVRWRETRDIWFPRLVIPYAFGVAGLTIWYILRYYMFIRFPAVQSLAVISVLSFCMFFLILLISWLRKRSAAG